MTKIIRSWEDGYKEAVKGLVLRGTRCSTDIRDIENIVREIIENVHKGGDEALIEYTKRFDGVDLTPSEIKVKKEEIDEAYRRGDKEGIISIKAAIKRIERFHTKQIERSWDYQEGDGVILGQIISPITQVGVYIPGGKASYPSSVLMNVIPAKIAGVKKIVMCTPSSHEDINPYVLISADISGVDEIFKVGGAQAIAAMAYGTGTIPKVDKIVGPGNIYVAIAKRLVFGDVGIDMIAGPTEILIIADETGRADYITADLLSQAEHDEMAVPILVTTSEELAEDVERRLSIQGDELSRSVIIEKSLERNGFIFIVKDMDEAIELSNQIGPEHLELAVDDPLKMLDGIENAGAIFLGHYTPEAVGDYMAGPSHVLPTGRNSRFSSPLGVYDFIKRSSLISYTERGLRKIADPLLDIARLEGLDAHARAVMIRKGKE
ncbi:MAG: histidinol dehydrogenase [Nitrospinae bacterium]|nr:histidinol dehydrogenase [Nitrospinota bacterium]